MDTGSYDSELFQYYTSLPDPCNECRRTSGDVIEGYSPSISSFHAYPECRELEELDAEILKLHNLALDLSNRRYGIKGRINARHDHFTLHLPLEIVSDIFTLVVHTPRDRKLRKEDRNAWNPPLDLKPGKNNSGLPWNPIFTLGAVCRQWREIIFDIPTLWTRLSIDPLRYVTLPGLTDQWLVRSGDLPLSLEFRSSFTHTYSRFGKVPDSEAVQLLKSHGNRVNELTLLGATAMLPTILEGLDDRLVVESLWIDMQSNGSIDTDNGSTMKYPFVPKRLHVRSVPVIQVPLQWDRLTYLKAKYISVDGMLHIVRNAHNLQKCHLHYVREDEGHYPITTSPVTNDSVKELDIKFKRSSPTLKLLLENLTFPALEKLRFGKSEGRNTDDMNALHALLDRSQPPLHDFSFRHASWRKIHDFDWYRILPSITSLELDLHKADKEITQNHVDSLGAHVEPIAFPHLRNLTLNIHAQNITPQWWIGLVAMFHGGETDEDGTPIISTRRPLKTVNVTTHPPLYSAYRTMDMATFSRLRTIINSGVQLRVMHADGTDILRPGAELTVSEYEDNHDDESECCDDEMGMNIEELY